MKLKLKFVQKFNHDYNDANYLGKIIMTALSLIVVVGFIKLLLLNPYLLFIVIPMWILYEFFG